MSHGFGWNHTFVEQRWEDVRDFLRTVWGDKAEAAHLLRIIDDVLIANADEVLAVTTSMHDIVIAPKPTGDPPFDVLVVRAPGSLESAAHPTLVRIDHLSVQGRNTTIQRPTADAVPFFWSFMRVEFGIERLLDADGERETAPTTIHCPKCGAVMVEVNDELTCIRGEMGLSQVMRGILANMVATGKGAPLKPSERPWGGAWHCPADGTLMTEADGRVTCPQCERCMAGPSLYLLIEHHPHS